MHQQSVVTVTVTVSKLLVCVASYVLKKKAGKASGAKAFQIRYIELGDILPKAGMRIV